MTATAVFLNEGANSYIDALTAIKAFENAVCQICGEVYDRHKPQRVSKVGLKDAHWRDHNNIQPAHRFAELGVCQDSPSGRETIYVYLRGLTPGMARPRYRQKLALS
jgi:hypothetical protein